jgi:hypothetical protein
MNGYKSLTSNWSWKKAAQEKANNQQKMNSVSSTRSLFQNVLANDRGRELLLSAALLVALCTSTQQNTSLPMYLAMITPPASFALYFMCISSDDSITMNAPEVMVKGILKDRKSRAQTAKSVKFHASSDNGGCVIGHTYPGDEYDRSSVSACDPKSLVDMMTYMVAKLPSDADQELDEYAKMFFLKVVLGQYRNTRFGTCEWVQENEPFFSETLHRYVQFDTKLKHAAVERIRRVQFHLKARLLSASSDRALCLEDHLTKLLAGCSDSDAGCSTQ